MRYIILGLLLFGCTNDVIKGKDGSSCTTLNGSITCEDGSHSIIHNGSDGKDGAPGESIVGPPGESITGPPGSNGHNSVTSLLDVLPSQGCDNGGVLFSVGLDLNDNNLLDTNEVQHASLICNGSAGQDAVTSPFTPVDIIDPCGTTPGYFNEVLIRLSNGLLLATISKNMAGDYTRLGIVPAGNWMTTDETNCHFTVQSNGLVIW